MIRFSSAASGLPSAVIRSPLVHSDEKWSGEKMIVLPSLIDPSLIDTELLFIYSAVPTPSATLAW